MRVPMVVITLAVLVLTSPVLAEECAFHRIQGHFALMDEPLEGFDLCYSSNVRGTANGQMVSCYREADFYPSEGLWGDGDYQYWIGKGSDFLETKKGELVLEERGVFDLGSELVSGQAKVSGGTGEFEAASGMLQFYNRYPNRLDLFVYEGFICFAED